MPVAMAAGSAPTDEQAALPSVPEGHSPLAETANAQRATMKDIADQVGVSVATVSRVLNGRPDVSRRTRELVLQAVREWGPVPGIARTSRGISGARTGLVGVTVPVVHYEYYALILSGITEALYEQQLRLVLCPTRYEHIRERTLVELLVHDASDGGVLIMPTESPDELQVLHNQGYPFVVVDPREELPPGIPTVSSANVSGAKDAVDHLIALGHRRIGAITGPRELGSMEDRFAGYCAALAAVGVLPDPELMHRGNLDIPSGRAAASALLSVTEPPTAIFAFNDNMAVGAIQAARERGLDVPRDLSVVGFDALEASRIVTPELTTVRQPLEEMGRLAVRLLLSAIEGQRGEAMRIELATALVPGASTAELRT
jgi:LacI family transcriptional regulator